MFGTKLAIIFSLTFIASLGHAVEDAKIMQNNVVKRWAVIGVISGADVSGKPLGIVVLKDQYENKTKTLSIGESLPGSDYKITAAKRSAVTVSNGEDSILLGNVEVDRNDEVARVEQERQDFFEKYYESLSQMGDGEYVGGYENGDLQILKRPAAGDSRYSVIPNSRLDRQDFDPEYERFERTRERTRERTNDSYDRIPTNNVEMDYVEDQEVYEIDDWDHYDNTVGDSDIEENRVNSLSDLSADESVRFEDSAEDIITH